MLIECPDCGREVSDLAVACPQCARPIRTEASDPGTAPVVCRKCGTEYSSRIASECPTCKLAAERDRDFADSQPDDPVSAGGEKAIARERSYFITGFLLCVLVGYGGGWVVAEEFRDPDASLVVSLGAKAFLILFVFRLSRFLKQPGWLTLLYCVLTPFSLLWLIPFFGLISGVNSARRRLHDSDSTTQGGPPISEARSRTGSDALFLLVFLALLVGICIVSGVELGWSPREPVSSTGQVRNPRIPLSRNDNDADDEQTHRAPASMPAPRITPGEATKPRLKLAPPTDELVDLQALKAWAYFDALLFSEARAAFAEAASEGSETVRTEAERMEILSEIFERATRDIPQDQSSIPSKVTLASDESELVGLTAQEADGRLTVVTLSGIIATFQPQEVSDVRRLDPQEWQATREQELARILQDVEHASRPAVFYFLGACFSIRYGLRDRAPELLLLSAESAGFARVIERFCDGDAERFLGRWESVVGASPPSNTVGGKK